MPGLSLGSLGLGLSTPRQGVGASEQMLRMKAALALGEPRQVSGVDPLTVSATTTSATLPVTIARDDSRIRFLGGRWYNGLGNSPNTQFAYCQPRTNGEQTTTSVSTGLPMYRDAAYQALEFTLPAGQTEFEVLFRGQGSPGSIFFDIDGVGTNAAGYSVWTNTTPTFQYGKVALGSSGSDRVIRVMGPYRAFGGLRMPTGQTIGAKPVPTNTLSLAINGDSITAGTGASSALSSFAALLARRLGADNYINLGVGGSGYLARFPYTTVTVTTVSGSPSISVTSGTLVAGSYISGPGIPRDATVTVGATAGGTATISANATASASGVSVRNETGRNLLDRLSDVLDALGSGVTPDALILSAGVNDRSVAPGAFFPLDQMTPQVLTLLQAIRAAAPGMPIFVTGPWSDWNNPTYSATSIACRDAIFAAAAQVSRVYTLDVSTVANSGNRDTIWNQPVDIIHPVDAGHAIYAGALYDQIEAIVSGW